MEDDGWTDGRPGRKTTDDALRGRTSERVDGWACGWEAQEAKIAKFRRFALRGGRSAKLGSLDKGLVARATTKVQNQLCL